jgi:hypothetical protein
MVTFNRKLLWHTLKITVFGFLLGFFISYAVDHYRGYHAPGAQHCDYEDL